MPQISVINFEGNIYTNGRNINGELGVGNFEDSDSFQKMINENNVFYVKVYNGPRYTVALDSDGCIWICGSLQRFFGKNDPSIPIKFESKTKFVDISGGYRFFAALDSEGHIWSCGRYGDGQLGLGNWEGDGSLVQIPSNENFISISCGSNYMLAKDDKGRLWGCGQNTQYELSEELERSNIYILTIIDDYRYNDNQIFVAAGGRIELDPNGICFAGGRNRGFTLGFRGEGNEYIEHLTKIYIPVRIQEIACGEDATMALDINGDVWVCGENSSEELGINNDHEPVETFTRLDLPFKAISIYCDYPSLCVLDDDHNLWVKNLNFQGEDFIKVLSDVRLLSNHLLKYNKLKSSNTTI